MSVCLLLVGDGRDDLHERSYASLKEHLDFPFDAKVTVDDRDHQLGFAGAIAKGWAEALDTGCEFVFHAELDFEYLHDVPLLTMCRVLEQHPHLVQMCLLRQPVNDSEVAAGGIVQQHPGDYRRVGWRGHHWIEHRKFWSTNPSLYPAWIMRGGWPQEPESEGKFGINLFASDPRLRSAFWGEGEEWVEHCGRIRAGHGY